MGWAGYAADKNGVLIDLSDLGLWSLDYYWSLWVLAIFGLERAGDAIRCASGIGQDMFLGWTIDFGVLSDFC